MCRWDLLRGVTTCLCGVTRCAMGGGLTKWGVGQETANASIFSFALLISICSLLSVNFLPAEDIHHLEHGVLFRVMIPSQWGCSCQVPAIATWKLESFAFPPPS